MTRVFKGHCYFCGAETTSYEHAPPKLMFKGFDCDSITVPSCELHNQEKAGRDQAAIHAFLIPLHNDLERNPLHGNVKRAVEIARSSFRYTKRRTLSVPLIDNPPDELRDQPKVAYVRSDVNLPDWMRYLSAALLCDATRTFNPTINWQHTKVMGIGWINTPGIVPLDLEYVQQVLQYKRDMSNDLGQLNWRNGWSASPRPYPTDIYRFQLHIQPKLVFFRHIFYDQYNWYVFLEDCPAETTIGLMHKLETST